MEYSVLQVVVFQVLGKSAKPIPVLMFGVVLGRKTYPLVKYLIVLLIVVGVALFLYKDGGSGSHSNGDVDQWRLFHFLGLGEILVVRRGGCECVRRGRV